MPQDPIPPSPLPPPPAAQPQRNSPSSCPSVPAGPPSGPLPRARRRLTATSPACSWTDAAPLVLQQLPWPAGDVRSALPSPFRCRERPFSERVPGSGISRSSLVTTLDFHCAGRAKAGRTSQSPFPSRFSSAVENAAVLSLLRRNRASPSTSPQPGSAVCPLVWERRSFLLGEVPRACSLAAKPQRPRRPGGHSGGG